MSPRLLSMIAVWWLLPPRLVAGLPHPSPPPQVVASIPVAPLHVPTQMVYKATPIDKNYKSTTCFLNISFRSTFCFAYKMPMIKQIKNLGPTTFTSVSRVVYPSPIIGRGYNGGEAPYYGHWYIPSFSDTTPIDEKSRQKLETLFMGGKRAGASDLWTCKRC